MSCTRALLTLVALGGCTFTAVVAGDPDGRPSDGMDGPPVPTETRHLLLTELAVRGPSEFIEIFNPTASTIDLSTYYLCDNGGYWKLPGHVAQTPLLTIVLGNSDFLVRFPAATLAPGAVATIAVDGVPFQMAFGRPPTFTIRGPVIGATPMVQVIPSAAEGAFLADAGEMMALFQWDGANDLVRDVDLVVAGRDPEDNNDLTLKTPVDGPDPDVFATPYALEARTIGDMMRDASGMETYKRIAPEEGHEVATGGNGLLGHDETSEQERMTWDSGTAPATPGEVPPALR